MFKSIFKVFFLLTLSACTTNYPNKNVVGKPFPSVVGQSLSKQAWSLPDDFKKEVVVLLVGYKQNSQFDIDRWLIGLDMRQVKVPVFEIPAIQGFFPQLLQGTIDDGMRSGIPDQLWKVVITIYKDGERVQEFTGNERPRNARVIVLNKEARVAFFHDGGFSVPDLNRLISTLESLKGSSK